MDVLAGISIADSGWQDEGSVPELVRPHVAVGLAQHVGFRPDRRICSASMVAWNPSQVSGSGDFLDVPLLERRDVFHTRPRRRDDGPSAGPRTRRGGSGPRVWLPGRHHWLSSGHLSDLFAAGGDDLALGRSSRFAAERRATSPPSGPLW